MAIKQLILTLFQLGILLFVFTGDVQSDHGGSHFCPQNYYVKVAYSQKYYTSCGWWGRSRCARYRTRYRQERRTNHHACCTGYTGSSCNIPICTSCSQNGVCIAPNDCYCRPGSLGQGCGKLHYCSASNDCYPGTCHETGQNCKCASGFEGLSCNKMRDGGTFQTCSMQLQVRESGVTRSAFSGTCGEQDENGAHVDDHSYFCNEQSPNTLKLDYEVIYRDQNDLPPIPSEYMIQARFGLVRSYTLAKMYNAAGLLVWQENITCNSEVAIGQSAPGEMNPHLAMHCKDVNYRWSQDITHNSKLFLEVVSETGGFKETKHPTTNFRENRTYIGTTSSQFLDITFDLKAPSHCSETKSCQDEFQVPCGWMPDLAIERNLTVRWFGWNDTDSKIQEYRYTIYSMERNDVGLLEETEEPFREEASWVDGDKAPRFYFDTPGMYSMILEVVDWAGNAGRARSLLLIDTINKVQVLQENPIEVEGANEWGGAFWMTQPSSFINVTWKNHFINRFHHDNGLLNAVKQRHDLIDDATGNRTTEAIPNVQGVVRFETTYNKDRGTSISNIPTSPWQNVELQQQSFEVEEDISDGFTVVVFVRAYDAVGNMKEELVKVHVDTTLAEYYEVQSTFEKNANSDDEEFTYASRAVLRLVDTDSGIREIKFTLVDLTTGTEVIVLNGTSPGQHHPEYKTTGQCGGECYCIPLGSCFTYEQSVWINHCAIKEYQGHQFRLDFVAINGAGSKKEGEYDVGILGGLSGIGHYPPPRGVRVINPTEFGTKATLAWYYDVSCYEIQNIRLAFEDGDTRREIEVPGDTRTYQLTDLRPNKAYRIDVSIVYEGGHTSSVETLSFSTGELTEEEKAEEGGLGAGAIIGIVIVVIIILLLVVLIVVMLLRRKQNKPMVPQPVRDATRRIRIRLSRQNPTNDDPEVSFNNLRGVQASANLAYGANVYSETGAKAAAKKNMALNVAYVPSGDMADEDDVYIYGNMETDPNAQWKISNDKLVIGNPLPNVKSRFADLKMATLHDKNGTTKVVAKMNKVGASEEDILLLKAKMNFLALNVPRHHYLVNFVAAIPPPQGPVILLEYCTEGKLQDWLKRQSKVTGDVEDSMINFCIQIASAMAFLHENDILHRRLGLRNILLTRTPTNQLVAKLMGFGPMMGEQDGDDSSNKKERIPIKWMAPEQFEKPKGQKRLYSKETDVWSYAIVCYEIFSKGDAPYPDISVQDVKQQVMNGYKMPKPEYCPEYMYEQIMKSCLSLRPSMRPTFRNILSSVKGYFEGQSNSEDYIYDEDGQPLYNNCQR